MFGMYVRSLLLNCIGASAASTLNKPGASVASAVSFLGRLESFATSQTTCLVTRSYKSTKRTHALRREITDPWFHFQKHTN
jgi:hypothetical protein